MTWTALVPVNRLDRAKGRLAVMLEPEQRRALTLATLATVLQAVAVAGGRALVLTADDSIARAVQEPHEVVPERAGLEGLNPQLEAAIKLIDGDDLLVLHADLPLASGPALALLRDRGGGAPSLTLVEADDGGTNAMLLRPPGRFPLAYGKDSASKHREAATAAGMAVARVRVPELELDLDTPGDVARLLASENGKTSAAGELLRSWGFERGGPG